MSPTTTTKSRSFQFVADEANQNELGAILAKIKLGTLLAPLKRVFTGLTAAASFDLTLIDGTGETVGTTNVNRLALLISSTLRVTASGTAGSVGTYALSDVGGTPVAPTGANASVGVATISDDGKTITFPNTITAFVIEYLPRIVTSTVMAADFAPTT